MSELTEKISKIIIDNEPAAGETMDAKEIAAEIAAMIEAERKPETGMAAVGKVLSDTAKKVNGLLAGEPTPDTITVPEAVSRLVDYFKNASFNYRHDDLVWHFTLRLFGILPEPDWIVAIKNGAYTADAFNVGLEDLFVSILTESEK